ncbi:Drooping leaf [Musa troglodytarum]|uniref:Drooping leaf n=1 Tax=Musa troglodytarum TaxID=320322 RepID=A0A9E7KQS4_9LILI|nr:Drooping leaf [Musa troglodytarum]
MDLVCPIEHLCYVRCTYCNTLLADGVTVNWWLMDRVTVNCGHCNHLSFLSAGDAVQCICPTSHLQMSLQGPRFGSRREPPSPRRSSASVPKKHRAPSAYNHFMREEIQRIKAAKPDIPHREAFSMAAKNWANSDPRNSSDV